MSGFHGQLQCVRLEARNAVRICFEIFDGNEPAVEVDSICLKGWGDSLRGWSKWRSAASEIGSRTPKEKGQFLILRGYVTNPVETRTGIRVKVSWQR